MKQVIYDAKTGEVEYKDIPQEELPKEDIEVTPTLTLEERIVLLQKAVDFILMEY